MRKIFGKWWQAKYQYVMNRTLHCIATWHILWLPIYSIRTTQNWILINLLFYSLTYISIAFCERGVYRLGKTYVKRIFFYQNYIFEIPTSLIKDHKLLFSVKCSYRLFAQICRRPLSLIFYLWRTEHIQKEGKNFNLFKKFISSKPHTPEGQITKK